MFEFLKKKMVVKKCPRCQKLFNKKKKKWEESDNTPKVIISFNSNKLLIENFSKIKFKDAFCSDCQNLFPGMTVAKFNDCLTTSGVEKIDKEFQ